MSKLSYETISAQRLTADQVASWTALLQTKGDLSSPFFCPEYTQVVAQVRKSVDVVVIRDHNDTVGFFPFERIDHFVGCPVGGAMSNFQGVIAAPGTPWSAADLAREAGLKVLQFDHQIREQPQFDRYTDRQEASPIVDVSRGWESYLSERACAGVKSFNALPRKMRKLEREFGQVTFVPHTTAPELLDQLIVWKRAQYARTNTRGSLAQDWAVEVIRRLMNTRGNGFSGMLSALFTGGKLIAAHAGIRSATAWHYWFPAYNPDVGQHSPGLVLIFEMCRWAADNGVQRIDLGPGEGPHKDLFANSETSVGIGQVIVPSYMNLFQRLRQRLRSIAR